MHTHLPLKMHAPTLVPHTCNRRGFEHLCDTMLQKGLHAMPHFCAPCALNPHLALHAVIVNISLACCIPILSHCYCFLWFLNDMATGPQPQRPICYRSILLLYRFVLSFFQSSILLFSASVLCIFLFFCSWEAPSRFCNAKHCHVASCTTIHQAPTTLSVPGAHHNHPLSCRKDADYHPPCDRKDTHHHLPSR